MKKQYHSLLSAGSKVKLVGLIAFLSTIISAYGDSSVVVSPTYQGSTQFGQSTSGSPGFTQTPRIRFGNSGSGEWQGWLQYQIPEAPIGEELSSVTIDFINLQNEVGGPGLVVGLISENSWDGDTIYYDEYSPVSGSNIVLATVGSLPTSVSGDITSYFDGNIASVGPGDTISIQVFRFVSGNRLGRTDSPVTLDVSFTSVPEPGAFALAAGCVAFVALAFKRRKQS